MQFFLLLYAHSQTKIVCLVIRCNWLYYNLPGVPQMFSLVHQNCVTARVVFINDYKDLRFMYSTLYIICNV